MELKSRWRALAFVLVVVALGTCVQGCFWFGSHDNWEGKHRGFAYETPEHTSQGHAHHHRASHW